MKCLLGKGLNVWESTHKGFVEWNDNYDGSLEKLVFY